MSIDVNDDNQKWRYDVDNFEDWLRRELAFCNHYVELSEDDGALYGKRVMVLEQVKSTIQAYNTFQSRKETKS